jgi:thioredoxin 1
LNKNIFVVGDADWNAEVLQTSGLVLVDFWAEWCPPCRKLTPVIEALADEFAGRVKVVKLNVDEAPEVAGRYGITSIPTLLLFRGGQVVDQHVGFRPREELKSILEAHQDVAAQEAAS